MPGLATGFGDRLTSGVVDSENGGRQWNPQFQPRTMAVDSQEVRWYVKKRKVTPNDTEEVFQVQGVDL